MPKRNSAKLVYLFLSVFLVLAVPTWSQGPIPDLDIRWTDNSNNEGGFSLERGDIVVQSDNTLMCTNFVELVRLPVNTISFTDNTVVPFRFYCYRVAAVAVVTNAEPQERLSDFSNIGHGVDGQEFLVVQ